VQLAVLNIVATVAAIIAAPLISLWVGGVLSRRQSARREKLDVLRVMLSLRHQPVSPEVFRSLNLIDAVFVDDAPVRDAWSQYLAAVSDPNLNNPPGYSIQAHLRQVLLTAIIKSLGLQKKLSTSDLLRTYYPFAVVEAESLALWQRVLKLCDLPDELTRHGIPVPEGLPQLLARYRSSTQAATAHVVVTNEKS
jgi:hypothetical protein